MRTLAAAIGIVASAVGAMPACTTKDARGEAGRPDSASGTLVASDMSPATVAEGQRIFRHETFGNEEYWTDTAKLHQVIATSLSPKKALAVGLKVDAEAIPADVAKGIKEGKVDLNSPATTLALIKLNAVVGVQGKVTTADGKDNLISVGITCALCHSTVDDSFAKGIGKRLDGWPNRDLNVGAIIALSPAVPPDQKAVYNSWGPGKYDPRFNFDGKSTPVVIPPAYGLATIEHATYTGEGSLSYWNAYVAVTQMHGQGTFTDDRLDIEVQQTPDRVTPLLGPLRSYQHSLRTPDARPGSFDSTAAERGRAVFERNCGTCHVDVTGTDNNQADSMLHKPNENGVSGAYAERTTNKAYRATPLRGLAYHPPYFHDGSAPTLEAVVAQYNKVRDLKLSPAQQKDLVEFLKRL